MPPTSSQREALAARSPSHPPRTEAQRRWRKAQLTTLASVKFRDAIPHAVPHELEHRAKEKAGFALAERACEFVSSLVSRALIAHGERVAAIAATRGRGLGRLFKRVARWLRRRGGKLAADAAVAPSVPLYLTASEHALHSLHIAMPALGTWLLCHVAHHDWCRARRERERCGTALTVAGFLFYTAALLDAVDAGAHALSVLSLTAIRLDHHAEHELHHFLHSLSIAAAVCGERDLPGTELADEQRDDEHDLQPRQVGERSPRRERAAGRLGRRPGGRPRGARAAVRPGA